MGRRVYFRPNSSILQFYRSRPIRVNCCLFIIHFPCKNSFAQSRSAGIRDLRFLLCLLNWGKYFFHLCSYSWRILLHLFSCSIQSLINQVDRCKLLTLLFFCFYSFFLFSFYFGLLCLFSQLSLHDLFQCKIFWGANCWIYILWLNHVKL